jgi:hypothetical protein
MFRTIKFTDQGKTISGLITYTLSNFGWLQRSPPTADRKPRNSPGTRRRSSRGDC